MPDSNPTNMEVKHTELPGKYDGVLVAIDANGKETALLRVDYFTLPEVIEELQDWHKTDPNRFPRVRASNSESLLAENGRLKEALEDLVGAVVEEVNSGKGGSGYLLARLSDARTALREAK